MTLSAYERGSSAAGRHRQHGFGEPNLDAMIG
jgi:hypothetical protein